ncbi:uncharacterized protein N7515_009818 [Penicillium bovifimosum]|uniref:ribonuclease H n=1 Tax=Penicillium bovifimosum TaxID=126998 RepID=A0A9W9GHP4_9EURO|nr:uncharacterized protein N7515_009818 [Penicillium bovifimosum]KAJ5120430.1 hypothetical protein N7515_009818 [Penicillium bovifimosum]
MPSKSPGSIPGNAVQANQRKAKPSGTHEVAQAPHPTAHTPQHHGLMDPRTLHQIFHGCVHRGTEHSLLPGAKEIIDPETFAYDKMAEYIVMADRLFIPGLVYPLLTTEEIQVNVGSWVCLACPHSKTKCLRCNQYEGHEDTLIIGVHGECVTEGNTTRSAIGLWYGDGNCANSCELISREDKHTKQNAELNACLRALRHAIALVDENMKLMREGKFPRPLSTLVIKMDSEYVVLGLTKWLLKWKRNGWKTCKGAPVANAELFKALEDAINVLDKDIQIKFWLVSKEENQEARYSTKLALRSAR